MDKVFGEAAKYYSTIVSGLWQVDGTVGLGFRVFYAAESKVTKEAVNETLRNARSTALMKFTLDDIVITDVFPKSSSTSARKLPLDFWEIALILGALLVLTLFTVIVLLTVSRLCSTCLPPHIHTLYKGTGTEFGKLEGFYFRSRDNLFPRSSLCAVERP